MEDESELFKSFLLAIAEDNLPPVIENRSQFFYTIELEYMGDYYELVFTKHVIEKVVVGWRMVSLIKKDF